MGHHRNKHLHGNKDSIPEIQRKAINDQVTNEWNVGISVLLAQHQYHYQGFFQEKLRKSDNYKHIWFVSVWTYQETTNINHLANHKEISIRCSGTTQMSSAVQ